MPSVDPTATPLVTNPEGIELFDSAPPNTMPAEVELRTKEVQERKRQKVSA